MSPVLCEGAECLSSTVRTVQRRVDEAGGRGRMQQKHTINASSLCVVVSRRKNEGQGGMKCGKEEKQREVCVVTPRRVPEACLNGSCEVVVTLISMFQSHTVDQLKFTSPAMFLAEHTAVDRSPSPSVRSPSV
ncbi:uncharacterized protein V6R79_011252 [Siganus canaliculatus]